MGNHPETTARQHRSRSRTVSLACSCSSTRKARPPSACSPSTRSRSPTPTSGSALGRTPIRLPEPVDELTRTVVTKRKGHATIGATAASRWLFPGGQPGRPISTERLKLRLNRLGIRPNQARSTALFQLATEIPAAILARTLGISVNSAVRWQQISAGDWTSYAADVSRRPTSQTRTIGGIQTV